MKRLIAVFLAAASLGGLTLVAATYSIEATMSPQQTEGTLNVDVRVSRLLEQGGKLAEHLIEAPRIKTAPGVPATLYTGPRRGDRDYTRKENVTVEVSWPYPNESGVAFCAITVKRGDKVTSKSRLQVMIEGPGRTPLIIATRDVDPKSVRVVEENSQVCLLLEFVGKGKEEVKKLATQNYGNNVRILDVHGNLTEGGLSFGSYHEVGLALHYKTRDQAEQAALLLRGENPK